MTEFFMPYGESELKFHLPEIFKTDTLIPEEVQPLKDPEKQIRDALENPLGRRKYRSISDIQSIGIAVNDKTRPIPNPNPLYGLLEHLRSLGFDQEQIAIFIGSGTHSPMRVSELPKLLSNDVIANNRIIVHDCDHSPLVDLGHTPHRTPILINADFAQCDLKITVGNIEPHHFMGFSGGVKTAVIGLAGRETINTNHAMLKHPQARSGVFHINPMRQDIEVMGEKAKIDFSLGTVLNEQKEILSVFFGDPQAVMKAAIPVVQQIFGVQVPEPYDLVIASPGGAPKDINLYQAQKGLTHAARITRDGGWVVLLAACPEGSGSRSYEDYIENIGSHQAVIDAFNNGFFQIGPHKAFQIAREAVLKKIVLISEIPPAKVKNWKLTPSTPQLLQPLLDWIAARLPYDARIAVMPASTRTMTEISHG